MDFKKVKKTTWAVCAMALTLVLLEITVTYCYGIIADGTSLSDTSTPLPLVACLVSGLIGFFTARVYAKVCTAVVKLVRVLVTAIVEAIFG